MVGFVIYLIFSDQVRDGQSCSFSLDLMISRWSWRSTWFVRKIYICRRFTVILQAIVAYWSDDDILYLKPILCLIDVKNLIMLCTSEITLLFSCCWWMNCPCLFPPMFIICLFYVSICSVNDRLHSRWFIWKFWYLSEFYCAWWVIVTYWSDNYTIFEADLRAYLILWLDPMFISDSSLFFLPSVK